jgi:ubiquinone/menaquinone biosynthesis C-methylase UbiE
MNARHSKVTDWGLSQASIGKQDIILDVGCGGGRTVSKLAAIATKGIWNQSFDGERGYSHANEQAMDRYWPR